MALNLKFLLFADDQTAAGVASTEKGFDRLLKKSQALGRGMAAAGAAITGAMALSIKSAADMADEVQKASDKTGIATESLSALKFAAEQSGIGFTQLEKALARQSRAASEAQQGIETYADVYKELGVSVEDAEGNLKDGETLFLDTAEALSQVENASKRAALAQDIFGGAGARLLPLMLNGADGIRQMTDRARELGFTFDEEVAQKAVAMNDAINEVRLGVQSLGLTLVDVLGDDIKDAAQALAEFLGDLREWAELNPELAAGLVKAAAKFGIFLSVVGSFLIVLPALVKGLKVVGGLLGLGGAAAAGAGGAGAAGAAAATGTAATAGTAAVSGGAAFGVGKALGGAAGVVGTGVTAVTVGAGVAGAGAALGVGLGIERIVEGKQAEFESFKDAVARGEALDEDIATLFQQLQERNRQTRVRQTVSQAALAQRDIGFEAATARRLARERGVQPFGAAAGAGAEVNVNIRHSVEGANIDLERVLLQPGNKQALEDGMRGIFRGARVAP